MQSVQRDTEYLKPIFGFALKRCRSIHDAEDLSQEIATKAFRALLAKDDVGDAGKYIWTVARTAVATIGTTAILSQVDWAVVASTVALAAILSVLTSIAGLPEVEKTE